MQELHKVLPPDDVPPWIPDPDASRALYGVGMGRLAGWGKLGRGGQNRMPRTSAQEGTEDGGRMFDQATCKESTDSARLGSAPDNG